VISVASDGSGVLRLGAMVVISSTEMRLVTELLR